MNLDELWGLTQWVQAEIVKRRIPELYNDLASVVEQNTQPNRQRVSIESEKLELLDALRHMDLSTLTGDQRDFLSDAGIAGYIGETGAKNVEEILYQGGLDIVTAAKRLEEIAGSMAQALDRFNNISGGLDGLVTLSASPIQSTEVLLRVTFTGDASISDVVDLKDWSEKWHTIARGIAMAHNQPPESVRVVGAARGSIILELATILIIAKTASAIILESLKLTGRVVGILQQVETLKAMRLSNKKIAADLKKEAEKERTEGVAQISKTITEDLGLKKDGDGDKINALESAIKTLVTFLTKGGEVDCVVPGESEDAQNGVAQARAELSQTFREIRSLEQDLRRIEHKPDDDEE